MRILIAVVFMALLGGGASAQSCSQLRAQLASAQSGGPDRAALSSLQAQARAYGCNSDSRFGQHRNCAGIMARMAEARSGGSSRRVRQLRRRVQRVCASEERARNTRRDTNSQARSNQRDEPRNIFSAIFEDISGGSPRGSPDDGYANTTRQRAPEIDSARRTARSTQGEGRDQGRRERSPSVSFRGVYRVSSPRTMCVRLCDGFYFPINRYSHYTDFYDELAMCVGRCPGADVSLYAHNRSARVETMRSTMTGERYVDLPTAFVYRRQKVDDCSCQPGTMMAEDATAEKALASIGPAEDGDERAADESGPQVASIASGPGPNGTRLTAIYEATGEPLQETLQELRRTNLRDDGALPPPEGNDARGTEGGETVAAASTVLRVREVGPRFFSASEAEMRRRQRILPSLTSTTVRLVPVAASARRTAPSDAPADTGETLTGSEPAEVEALAPSEEAARTSRLAEDRSGG